MQKRNGISLIVLVITIIVMIVLAGAIILSLNNSGIIEKTNQAVKETDKATVKELAQMAWGEAYASGERKVDVIEARVKEVLRNNGLEVNNYGILVTAKGVDIVKGWIQDKTIIKRGDKELTVGQTVKYTATGTDYAGEWKLLGADEDGNILIMSASDVKTEYKLGGETLEEAQTSWLNGVDTLNNECKGYAIGSYAIKARSITVEDVNKITGYDPNSAVFNKGKINEYGNKVTYIYSGTDQPNYIGSNKATGKLTHSHWHGFYWYDGSGWKSLATEVLEDIKNNEKEIATITNDIYHYFGKTLTDKEDDSPNGLNENTEAYKMIFGTSDSLNRYWLASPSTHTAGNVIMYSMRMINDRRVHSVNLWRSDGKGVTPSRGVRAVITLQSEMPLSSLI